MRIDPATPISAAMCAGLLLVIAVAAACDDAAPHAREASHTATAKPASPAAPAQPTAAEPNDGLSALDGDALRSRMLQSGDKGTLVSVWASWCGSCKKELPMISAIAPWLRDQHIGLVLISADDPKDRAKAAAMRSQLIPERDGFIVRGPLGPFKRALNPEWKGSLPSTFLFDAQGALRYFWPGPVLDYEISDIIGMFLAGKPLVGPQMAEHGPPE